ncbi:MAG: hypothetical protein MUP98_13035, partial [Candidatus Aminicenantes bacterium]|nr:hypothetical protein [Candidatus Aminicenantes bacterium]
PPPPKNEKMLKKDYQMLSEKEEMLRAKLDKVTDPKEKSELKATLVEVLQKQDKIEAYLAEANGNGSNGSSEIDLKLDDLKKQYIMLDEKAEDLRLQIKNTDDPDTKAKCKQMLVEILNKQKSIKETAEAIQNGKKGEKIK